MNTLQKKMVSIIVALALIVLPMMSSVTPVFATNTEIVIYHTNDMHGDVGNLAYVKSMKNNTPNSILVDAGDPTQGSSLATYTEGMAIIQLMNEAGYDGMVLGNHEFDYGTEVAIKNAKAANFPIIGANVFDKQGNVLLRDVNDHNGESFIITVDGVRVGFFGITTTETTYKSNPARLDGVTFEEEIKIVKEQVQALQNEADIIVGLLHVGIDSTSDPTSHRIAREVEGIDVLIDGHSHSEDQTVIEETDTLVVQTGTKLANIGEIKIQYDTNTSSVSLIESQLIDKNTYTSQATPDEAYTTIYNEKMAVLEPILGEVISYTGTSIFTFDNDGTRVSRLEETPAGDLVADAMARGGRKLLSDLGYGLPVVALQNGGGVRADITSGSITVGDILNVLPFGNSISIKSISPAILYEVLEVGYATMEVTEEGYLNIDNANGGFSQISGMRVVIDADQEVGNKVKEIYLVDAVSGETFIDRNDTVTEIALVSNDFLIAGGDGYTMLKGVKHIAEGGALDFILQQYIKDNAIDGEFIYAHTNGRIEVEQINAIQNTGYLDLVPNITLAPSTNYNITIDGIETMAITTDATGHFLLEKVTNGVHTVSVDGKDYYISSYTNLGLLSLEVVEAPAVTPIPPVESANTEGTKPTNATPIVASPSNTGDSTIVSGSIFAMLVSGLYLGIYKKKHI